MNVSVRRLPISHGVSWFATGWHGFTQAPGLLIGVLLLWFIIAAGLGLIPILGSLVSSLIAPALYGGYLLMSRTAIDKASPSLEQFFSGLTRKECRGDALVLGLILLVGHLATIIFTVAAFALFSLLIIGEIPMDLLAQMRDGTADAPEMTVGMLLVLCLTLVVALVPYIGLAMALTYAAPLVLDNRGSAMSAMKISFRACLRNILPLTLFALIYLLLAIVAMIPLGLGLLILVPVSLVALAHSYAEIFPATDDVDVIPEV